MSVTIADILKLPSLQGAKVIAGHSNLDNIVSSVSVLEAVVDMDNPPGMSRHYGHEIIITGFIAIKDDIEKQCDIIRLMHKIGEIGMILFYVGAILKEVDSKLIATADSLNMPLIVMPENRLELRYSDVICEVIEEILNDRRENTHFATDVIEQISRIKDNKRSINSVLSIIRDQVQCSIFLFDGVGRLMNMAEWPSGRGLPADKLFAEAIRLDISGCAEVEVNSKRYFVARECLQNADAGLDMLVVNEKQCFTRDCCKQIKYIVKTYLNLWTENYAQLDEKQLLNAIINNETEKMQRIADILRINVCQMDCAYFFVCNKEEHNYELLKEAMATIKNFLTAYNNVFLTEIFDETIVVLANRSMDLIDKEIDMLLHEIKEQGLDMLVAVYNYVPTTLKVKQAYWQINDMKKYLPVVFPMRRMVTSGEIDFIVKTREHLEHQTSSKTAENPIGQMIYDDKRKVDLMETLEVFLLDANMSIQKTAELMFTHQNTIKYRLKIIEKIFGYKLTKIPESYDLYVLAATNRLSRVFFPK